MFVVNLKAAKPAPGDPRSNSRAAKHRRYASPRASALLRWREMRCWAFCWSIRLTDEVNELPIIGALVHCHCYEQHTGQRPPISRTLFDYLADTPLATA